MAQPRRPLVLVTAWVCRGPEPRICRTDRLLPALTAARRWPPVGARTDEICRRARVARQWFRAARVQHVLDRPGALPTWLTSWNENGHWRRARLLRRREAVEGALRIAWPPVLQAPCPPEPAAPDAGILASRIAQSDRIGADTCPSVADRLLNDLTQHGRKQSRVGRVFEAHRDSGRPDPVVDDGPRDSTHPTAREKTPNTFRYLFDRGTKS